MSCIMRTLKWKLTRIDSSVVTKYSSNLKREQLWHVGKNTGLGAGKPGHSLSVWLDKPGNLSFPSHRVGMMKWGCVYEWTSSIFEDDRWLIFFISIVIFTMWKQREPSSGSWMQGYVLHMLTLSLIRCMTWRNCSDFSNTDFFPCVWMSEIMMLASYKERKRKKVKSLSRVWLFATPWTVAYQAPPSMGFSRKECWSGLPFPSPGDLPGPGIKPRSPTLQADALPTEPPGKPLASYKAIQ